MFLNREKNQITCLVVIMLCWSTATVFAGPLTNAKDNQQCIDTSLTYQRLQRASSNVISEYISDPTLYTNAVEMNDTLIDVRETGFDTAFINTRINGALNIPLEQLKAKNYLKLESLIIISDGFNNYLLEKEIKKLHLYGFVSVKILRRGILSLMKNKHYLSDPDDVFQLRLIKADKIIAAATERADQFLFINLGKMHKGLKNLELNYIHIPYNRYQIFHETLKQELQPYLRENKNINVVMVHDNADIYRQILASKGAKKWLNLWFIQGGNASLVHLDEVISTTANARKRVTVSCSG